MAKPTKLKARLPRGLADRGPAEIAATRHMVEAIRAVFERYGFEPVETPAIEYTDALGKFLPDQDRPNEGVFSFQDDDEQWLSLRYDLTAPLARYVAENFQNLPLPTAAIATAGYSAMRSPDQAASASSCSSMLTLSARFQWPPMPRCACSRRTR
jgi:histidyl-tRNA synthetase